MLPRNNNGEKVMTLLIRTGLLTNNAQRSNGDHDISNDFRIELELVVLVDNSHVLYWIIAAILIIDH